MMKSADNGYLCICILAHAFTCSLSDDPLFAKRPSVQLGATKTRKSHGTFKMKQGALLVSFFS